MANNNRIKILRGDSATISSSSQKLASGQPLYNTDKNYLTIGNSSGTTSVNALPITVREINGYLGDSSNITSSTSNNYIISGDETKGLYIKSPTAINFYLDTHSKTNPIITMNQNQITVNHYIYVPSPYYILGKASLANAASNVTSYIGGKALDDIFESDGVTAIKATDATYSAIANNLKLNWIKLWSGTPLKTTGVGNVCAALDSFELQNGLYLLTLVEDYTDGQTVSQSAFVDMDWSSTVNTMLVNFPYINRYSTSLSTTGSAMSTQFSNIRVIFSWLSTSNVYHKYLQVYYSDVTHDESSGGWSGSSLGNVTWTFYLTPISYTTKS